MAFYFYIVSISDLGAPLVSGVQALRDILVLEGHLKVFVLC